MSLSVLIVPLLAVGLGALWWATAPPAPTIAPAIRARPTVPPRTCDALDVARMVERLATVLGSGVGMQHAWSSVAESLPAGELAEFARRLAVGGDPQRAAGHRLRRLRALTSLRMALEVCGRTGAPAAGVLTSLAGALRDLHDADLARRSAFAGPRATARILLVLPLAGIGLGMLIGVDPLGVLVGTSQGRVLLVVGVALTAAGWWWMHRLLSSAGGREGGGVDVSVVLDLVSGPLTAGIPLSGAIEAVGSALGPDDGGRRLQLFAEALRAGVPPRVAVRHLDEDMAPLRDAALLAHSSGADLAQILRSASRDRRRALARDAEAAAARLAVRLVLPTGLTLLPAFVVLGIIPTVSSLLGGAFDGGALLGGAFEGALPASFT